MNLFGKNITLPRLPGLALAAAPRLPAPRADKALTEILPPFGTNPPTGPLSSFRVDYENRAIRNDPRELWYLALPSKLSPNQVLQILRAALGGDVWQQWQLLSLMLDTWPMFRKCAHELRQAVASVEYVAHPYVEDDGDEPTDSAKEKADAVNRALRCMRPDPFTDEKDSYGMMYDITDMFLNGLTLIEILWAQEDDTGLMLPRAAAWVHPRHYTFTNEGRIAVFDDLYRRLTYPLADVGPAGAGLKQGDPLANKFLCAQFMSRSGSSLGAGLMRPLAWDWSAMVYNREWMLQAAQKYGSPFLDGTYKTGSTDEEMSTLKEFMSTAGANGWVLHPEGSTVEVHPAQSLGADNHHTNIMRAANENCQYLLLGQTGSTQGTPGKLGDDSSRFQVRREVVEAGALAVSTQLRQLACAIVRLNWGDETEIPTMHADFTEPLDPQAQANVDSTFLGQGVPIIAADFYKRNGMKMPETGDVVIKGGQIGKLADTTQEVGGPQPMPGAVDPETGEPLDPNDPNAQAPGDDEEAFAADDEAEPGPVAARSVRRALRRATDEELEGIISAARAATLARHTNGEHALLRGRLGAVTRRTRL